MRSLLCLFVPLLALARPYPTNVGTPSPALGNGGTFSFGFRPDGITNRPISTVYMAIESSPGADGCYFSYWPQWGIFLADRSGNAVGPLAPGSVGSIENQSCRVSGAGSYASRGVDGELTVGLSVTFKAAMPAGTKPLWSAALDGVGNSGWVQNMGEVYCVRACTATNLVPVVEPLTPEQRTGAVERFTFEFSDGNGASDISNALVLINGGLDSRDACLLSIDPLADFGRGVAYFVTDRGPGQVVTVDTLFPGNGATVGRNEQCEVQGGSLSIIKISTTVRVSMSITMKGAGTKQIYMAALDQRGGNSTWVNRGAWVSPAIVTTNPDQLNPGCAGAWTCTSVSRLDTPVFDYTSNIRDPALVAGPVELRNFWEGWLPRTTTRYSNFKVTAVKYQGQDSCPAGHRIGPAQVNYAGVQVGSSTTSLTTDQINLLVSVPIRYSLSAPGFGPGYYYFRMEVKIDGTNNGQPAPPTIRYWHSGCIRAGFAPQIDGLRDNVTGLPQIERGSETGAVEIYGAVNGTSGTSISPSQAIRMWQIMGVYPQSGQVNVSYAVDRSATPGSREVKLYNGLWSLPWPLYVVDPEPQITSVVPDRPWQPGETVTVTLNGKGLGSNPRVSLRSSDGDTVGCLGSEEVTIVGPAAGVARDTQIVFTKTVPSNSSGCAFEIGVVTSGISGQFYSGPGGGDRVQHATRSGTVLVPTPARLVTFIVHGLSDSPYSFWNLRNNLERTWLEQRRFHLVDVGFDFPGCSSIRTGAAELAAHVGRFPFSAGDRIAFVAHSMGGLMVRRMLADGLLKLNVPVAGLVTLGTPHVGYPYLAGLDEQVKCGIQVQEMAGQLWNGNPLLGSGTMSPFLTELYSAWNVAQVGYRWLAAGGAFCSERTRSWPSAITSQVNGCRRENPLSDGVVCLDSATLTYPQTESRMVPTERFSDPEQRYMHGRDVGWAVGANVLCGTPVPPFLDSKRSLTDPPREEPLFEQIWRFLNAL